MMVRRLLWVLLVQIGLLLPSAAYADDTEPAAAPSEEVLAKAQLLLSEANAHYAAERYDEARQAYQAAYELTDAPGFLYNIAQSHRLAGQCRLAIEHYEEFLSLDGQTELRSKVEGFVAEMWICLEEEKRVLEEKEKSAQETSLPTQVEGDNSGQPLVAAPASPGAERAGTGGPSRLPIVGITIAASGVLALGTSAYYGLSARARSKEVESYEGLWGTAQEADEKEAQRFEKLAIVLGVAGTVALAGGVATYLLTRERSGRSVAVIPSKGGLMLAFSSTL